MDKGYKVEGEEENEIETGRLQKGWKRGENMAGMGGVGGIREDESDWKGR